jgi:hypothetical protein
MVGASAPRWIYGDGAITPAISMLSALEGMDVFARAGTSTESNPPRDHFDAAQHQTIALLRDH